MTGILKDPPASASPQRHADWLELLSLSSADRNSSIQDIQRVFSRSGTTDAVDFDGSGDDDDSDDRGSERSQQIAEDAFAEVEARQMACQTLGGYPFDVSPQSLEATPKADDAVYTFLLLLSHYGKDAGLPGINAEQLFDELCGFAAEAYLGGSDARSYQFGFPRRLKPAGFKDALDELCSEIGEGGGSKARPRRHTQKDARLDLAAWRPFADVRTGKLVAFGQCATGIHWKRKLTDLQPQAFCTLWMHSVPLVIPLKTFFVPHSVDRDYWDEATAYGGIVFDRIRIAALTNADAGLRTSMKKWSKDVLRKELRA